MHLRNISSFNDNQIKNLNPEIKKLKICNQLTSFEGSENLPRGLKELDLWWNQITSFKGSENLPRGLEKLSLWNNQITSFEGSENLPRGLRKFDFYGNPIYNSKINILEYIKKLQCKKDFENCLNEIKYNPRLNYCKENLEKESKIFEEDPELLFSLINNKN